MKDRDCDYSIDGEDTITSVNDSWLEFARSNRAAELTRDRVVGESLWSFIAGQETRLLYEGLFQKVRTLREPIELPFRCDSPDRFRFMRLSLQAGHRDEIRCRGVLIREQHRPYYSILDRAFPRSDTSLTMCSLCQRVLAFESRWIELEDAISELKLFGSANVPTVQYAVCDLCASTARGTVCAEP